MKRFVTPKFTEIIKNLRAGVDIKKIDLCKCVIGDEEVKLLVQTLENYNNTVTDIYLSGNRITNEGAKWIAHLLEENKSVTFIDLRDNKIGNDGARLILQAVKKNKIVTEIPLYGNKSLYGKEIDYKLQGSIDTILEKNIQAKEVQDEEALSKKSDQGIDLAQEKLPATDIGLAEKQGSSKGMQQLQEVVQEQKSEQQEGVNAALNQIVNKQIMHGDMLESMTKQLQQLGLAIVEIKLLLKELSSIPVGQTQLTENSSGTEIIGEHSKLLLGVVNLETDI